MNIMNHRLSWDLFLNPRPHLNEAITKLQQKEFLNDLIDKFFLKNGRVTVVKQMMAETEIKE